MSFKVHQDVGNDEYIILCNFGGRGRVSEACHLRYVTASVKYAQRLSCGVIPGVLCHFSFYRPHIRTLSKCEYRVCSLGFSVLLNSLEHAHM